MKLPKLVLAGVILMALVAACKPSEANYRQAYEAAMTAREQGEPLDSTIYGTARRQTATRTVALPDGSKTDVTAQLVRITEGGGGIRENLHRYCVVGAQFKQRFNALSMRQRLADDAYPGAFVVETSEPYYYVVVFSTDDLAQAAAFRTDFAAQAPVPLKAPAPFILQASIRN